MDWAEIVKMAEALGTPVTVIVVVLVILSKNGWWKLIIRGEKDEELAALQSKVDKMDQNYFLLMDRVRATETKVAVLEERTKTK